MSSIYSGTTLLINSILSNKIDWNKISETKLNLIRYEPIDKINWAVNSRTRVITSIGGG